MTKKYDLINLEASMWKATCVQCKMICYGTKTQVEYNIEQHLKKHRNGE